MGLGDNLMASGMAKGAAQRGKRIAFGNGSNILWDQHSEQIFRNNPNVAPPGSEGSSDLEWIPFYKGNRIYNRHDHINDRWLWNYDFKAVAGEVFFHKNELEFARRQGEGFIVIEPYVPAYKGCAPNKDWSISRYLTVIQLLKAKGYDVRQFSYSRGTLPGTIAIQTPSFRHALAVLSRASIYIGPEGGLHHGAAAVGIPAVVIFGGFIPPQITGYDTNINMTGGAEHFCGSLTQCDHCRKALDNIGSKEVYRAAKSILEPASVAA